VRGVLFIRLTMDVPPIQCVSEETRSPALPEEALQVADYGPILLIPLGPVYCFGFNNVPDSCECEMEALEPLHTEKNLSRTGNNHRIIRVICM